MLTKPQVSVMERAIAAANNVEPKLQMLEALAAHSPALMERVADLRTKQEFLRRLPETALTIHQQATRLSG